MASKPILLAALAALALAGPSRAAAQEETALPASAETARARLAASPRHGEWVVVRTGEADSVRAWVVYPERKDPAPVVVVVHEIYGLTDWIRAVADQLAADGFVAIAPDLLTLKNVPATPEGEPEREAAVAAIRTLDAADVHRQIREVAEYAMTLPAAAESYGVVGFCWGGAVAFAHAARSEEVDASVVYYGTSPEGEELARVDAPVLGLYGGDDARVNATIPRAEEALAGREEARFEPHVFEGAGHGFLRQQDGREGANLRAARAAWPLTLRWLREHLED